MPAITTSRILSNTLIRSRALYLIYPHSIRRRPLPHPLRQRHRCTPTVRRIARREQPQYIPANLHNIRPHRRISHTKRIIRLQTELHRFRVRPVLTILDRRRGVEVDRAVAGVLRVLVRVQRETAGGDLGGLAVGDGAETGAVGGGGGEDEGVAVLVGYGAAVFGAEAGAAKVLDADLEAAGGRGAGRGVGGWPAGAPCVGAAGCDRGGGD